MNPFDEGLNRLFRAVAAYPDELAAQPPFGLEARVMAAWREANTVPGSMWSTGILVRGLILAGVIMVVSLWPALDQKNNFDATSLQFADSSVQTDYP